MRKNILYLLIHSNCSQLVALFLGKRLERGLKTEARPAKEDIIPESYAI